MLTLTNGQLTDVHAGLSALDGLQTKDGFVPYRFSTDTVWLIASNITLIAERLKIFNAARKALAAQHGVTEGMKITTESAEKVSLVMKGLDDLTERSVTVEVERLLKASLDVGKNPIPAGVLARLMPIIE